MPTFVKRRILAWSDATIVDTPQVRRYFGDPHAPHHSRAEDERRDDCDSWCGDFELPLTVIVEFL